MEKEILVELIKIVPTTLLYAALLVLFLRYRRSLVEGVLPKITNLKAFGIEASFVREGIQNAARSQNRSDVHVSPGLMRRISHFPKRPLRVLWIDDNPDTVMYEAGILQTLGMQVEFAKTSANAHEKLRSTPFHLILSDIRRNDNPVAGLQFLQEIQQTSRPIEMIFYVSTLDRSLPVPVGAFGITDDPNELIHLALDAAERLD
ncbi:MAG: response regulator [Saprospiraceae bacterium]|nr:response regulator [Saprospiraceae bacterium]